MLSRGPEHAQPITWEVPPNRMWRKHICFPQSIWTLQTSCAMWKSTGNCTAMVEVIPHPGCCNGPNTWQSYRIDVSVSSSSMGCTSTDFSSEGHCWSKLWHARSHNICILCLQPFWGVCWWNPQRVFIIIQRNKGKQYNFLMIPSNFKGPVAGWLWPQLQPSLWGLSLWRKYFYWLPDTSKHGNYTKAAQYIW